MIYIEKERAYAKLTWDCITVQSKRIDPLLQGSIGEDLCRIMFRKFQKLAKKKNAGHPEFYGSAFTGTIDRLSPETARAIAEAYWSLLYRQLEEVM
jgi:hypothetical protein